MKKNSFFTRITRKCKRIFIRKKMVRGYRENAEEDMRLIKEFEHNDAETIKHLV